MGEAEQRRRVVFKILGGLAIVVLIVGFIGFVRIMMSLKISKPERQVQTIQLIRPPPPPPPPDQPPPPPEKVEQPLEQDKPEPTPQEPDQAQPDVLANEGPASAGSDAFGMHQGAGGFIGGAGTAPFAAGPIWLSDQAAASRTRSSLSWRASMRAATTSFASAPICPRARAAQ